MFRAMPSPTALTIYFFGVTSLIAGLNNLLWPDNALAGLDLPAAARPASNGMALAAIAMGLYYPLAAWQENKPFFILTVPMRMLSSTVFWTYSGLWRVASAWEGVGAILTGAALIWDLQRCRKGAVVNEKSE